MLPYSLKPLEDKLQDLREKMKACPGGHPVGTGNILEVIEILELLCDALRNLGDEVGALKKGVSG